LPEAAFGHRVYLFGYLSVGVLLLLLLRLRYYLAAGSVFGLQPCRAAYLF